MMAESQPLSAAPEGAEYLRAVLRAPVYEAAQITPLQKMEKLSSRLDNVVLVKREDRQPVRSFKLRGAYAMMAGLTEEQKSHGVITASAGNHAQGVAFSASRLGVKALIVMPTATADIKVDAVRGFGGEVLLHGANFDEAKAKAIELAQQQGFTWVPPFDHPMVIAGQGTLALELLQQDAHIDRVFVPVGGGGLAAGVAVLIKQLMPQIKVIAVEAEDSACLKAALDAGHPVDLPRVGLFAEGVAVKRIGDETFRLCQEYLDDIVTVDSDAICAAMKDLFEDVRAVAEPSGALALAGMVGFSGHVCANTDYADTMPSIEGKKLLVGYWHNWDQGFSGDYEQGYPLKLALKDTPKAFNVVMASFMKSSDGKSMPTFIPYYGTDQSFRAEVAALNERGQAVLLSLGGADAHKIGRAHV